MNETPTSVIARKRDGQALSAEQIAYFISGFADGRIPDYQMAAMAMAVYLRGMNTEETAALTTSMLRSGLVLEWPENAPPSVDKHSTGGIGDKVSLVLTPLLACCDVQVPMISGRGLGPTGGTLDKLESIPGFRTDLSINSLRAIVDRVGCVISGATAEIAPADKKLYALRDVTATVASVPLITASIMSKKLAEGLDALVLDVKFGSGAFMKTLEQARELADSLVNTGSRMGVPTTALLTDMNQPLGCMIGNAVEVDEAVTTLGGAGPADLIEITLRLGAEVLVAAHRSDSFEQAASLLRTQLDSGRGLEKLHEMVAAQGGQLEAPRPVAAAFEYVASSSGYVVAIDAERLGQTVIELGGGRSVITDTIDHSVGVEMLVKRGDAVEQGQPLARVFADAERFASCHLLLDRSFKLGAEPPESQLLIADRRS